MDRLQPTLHGKRATNCRAIAPNSNTANAPKALFEVAAAVVSVAFFAVWIAWSFVCCRFACASSKRFAASSWLIFI